MSTAHSDSVSTTEPARVSSAMPWPLDLPLGTDARWQPLISRLTLAFLIGAVVLRVARFLLRFPLWGDEAFLAVNFIHGSYGDMLRPLEYGQVSPPLFLWLELTSVRLFGFNEYSLRLPSLLAGLGSLFLFWHVARRMLQGAGLLLAVAIVSVAHYPMRYSVESKPYGFDFFVTLALVALVVEWLRAPHQRRWLWALVVAVPVALWTSLPAMFVAGAVCAALVIPVWRQRERGTWLAYLAVNGALVVSFGLLMACFIKPIESTGGNGASMQAAWGHTFPELTKPLSVGVWLLDAHTGMAFAYPNGSKNGGSTLTFLCVVIGVVELARRRQGALLILLLTPFLLGIVAAMMHRYPYNGVVRLTMYLGPLICLLMALGGTAAIARARRSHQAAVFAVTLSVLALMGSGRLIGDLVSPYKTVWDENRREFDRWLWNSKTYDAELVCLRDDLGESIDPSYWTWGLSAVYRCNQKIYSPRHREGRPADLSGISAEHPLRCVIFREGGLFDRPLVEAWLAKMNRRFELIGYDHYDVNPVGGDASSTYEVFEFAPRSDVARGPLRPEPEVLRR